MIGVVKTNNVSSFEEGNSSWTEAKSTLSKPHSGVVMRFRGGDMNSFI